MNTLPPIIRVFAALLLAVVTMQAVAADLRIGYAPNTFYAPILVAKQKKMAG